jgi:hypothetical protein
MVVVVMVVVIVGLSLMKVVATEQQVMMMMMKEGEQCPEFSRVGAAASIIAYLPTRLISRVFLSTKKKKQHAFWST